MMNADSIKGKLRNLARRENKPFDFVLLHYFIERLLYRLSISAYADNFILKGGLMLYAILDNDARATRDVDFLAHQIGNASEDMIRIFSEICSIEADDAIRYDVSDMQATYIKEDADYEGIRIKLTGYLDKSRHVLQFDIGYGDVIVPRPIEMDYPSLLDMERPHLKAYSRESVISEKFEAMISLADVNSRMKDFYDIHVLSHVSNFDGHILYEAINQTFERRSTPLMELPIVFSEEFAKDTSKQTQWAAFERRISVTENIVFESILARIKKFLLPIYECVFNKIEFSGYWSAENGCWDTGSDDEIFTSQS